MRRDYDYIDKASDLVLTTTDEGSKWLANEKFEKLEYMPGVPGDVDMMLCVEDTYMILSSGKSMQDWYEEYVRQYAREYEASTPTTFEQFKDVFVRGHVTIRKVIWDNWFLDPKFVVVDPNDGKITVTEDLRPFRETWEETPVGDRPWLFEVKVPTIPIDLEQFDGVKYAHELFSKLGFNELRVAKVKE